MHLRNSPISLRRLATLLVILFVGTSASAIVAGIPGKAKIAQSAFHGLVIAGHVLGVINGSFQFTGKIDYTNSPQGRNIKTCRGSIAMAADMVRWPARTTPVLQCTGLKLRGWVHHFQVTGGNAETTLRSVKVAFAAAMYQRYRFTNTTARVAVSPHALLINSVVTTWKQAILHGEGEYFFAQRSINFRLKANHLRQQNLFALISPRHVSIRGMARLRATVNIDAEGDIMGTIDLRGIGPGILYVRDIPVLENALAHVYGKGLATVTILELKAFPYIKEHLRIASGRNDSILSLSLKRGKGNPAKIRPRMITLNGHKFLFQADNMPSIHFTLPLPKTSLKELIQLANGQYAPK